MINGLPQRLQALRAKYGYSQKHVAAQLGVSPSIVSGYETGERTPSAEILLSLSYIYNCTTDYILGKQSAQPTIVLDTNGLSGQQIRALQNLIDTIKNP